jgi:hypothetical protein
MTGPVINPDSAEARKPRFSPSEADMYHRRQLENASRALLLALQRQHPRIVYALQRKHNVQPLPESDYA